MNEMASALQRFAQIDLVYGHNDPQAHGAWLAAQRAGRKGVRFLGIDALPHEGVQYVRQGILDATFQYPTGGAEAVDLALLAVAGKKLPREVILGSRLFTKDNLERNGEELPAPGARLMAELRAGHGDALRPDPGRAGAVRIGMSQCNLGEPWRQQMNEDIKAAAARYPQIQLTLRDAQNDPDRQRAQIDEFVAGKVDCLLVSPKETKALTPPVARAFQAGIPVIVIDRKVEGDQFTTFLGPDNRMVGEAAGRYAWKLLGGRGKVVELRGLMTSTPAQDRNAGFLDGLRAAQAGR